MYGSPHLRALRVPHLWPADAAQTMKSWYLNGDQVDTSLPLLCAYFAQSFLTLCDTMDCSLSGFSIHGIFLARVLDCHFLLQRIFLTQGSNLGFLHCRQMLYPLSHQGSCAYFREMFFEIFIDWTLAQCCCWVMSESLRLFATPRTAVPQAPLSITISWSLRKLMSIESVIQSNHLILCCPLLLLQSFPPQGLFQRVSSSHHVAKILEFQHHSFQLIFRVDFSTLFQLKFNC